MAKINVLDKSIYNKISAGEVVERPYSVVKELVENSVDAGATKIKIEVEEGGVKAIKVTDNGCGIERESVRLAFLPHSTSKISNADDLYKIETLGFRGEALASIASISHMAVNTKFLSEEIGSHIELDAGVIVDDTMQSANDGTSVLVENLFFNVPARLKFLKKNSSEEHEISNYVSRLILANPTIAISYYLNGKEVYASLGQGVEDAILAVYGVKVLQDLIPISYIRDSVKIYGYIGKPSFYKANKTYQTFILRNRVIANSNLSVALGKGFEKYLVKGQFPFGIVYIDLPSDEVDVNVHPNKTDVRFLNPDIIFSAIYRGVQDSILKHQELYSVENTMDSFNELDVENTLRNLKAQNFVYENKVDNVANGGTENVGDFSSVKQNEINTKGEEQIDYDKVNNFKAMLLANSLAQGDNNLKFNASNKFSTVYEQDNTQNIPQEPNKQVQEMHLNAVKAPNFEEKSYLIDISYKIIGKAFNAYLFLEQGDDLLVIDQHAAHERIGYDKLMEQCEKRELVVQPLLIPYTLSLNPTEYAFVEEHLEDFKQIGIEIEANGPKSFCVYAIPQIFNDKFNCQEFFNEVVGDVNKFTNIKEKMNLNHILATSACKHAVKAGDDLRENEIKALIDTLINKKTEPFCPHGRPIIVKFNKATIEKWFKRIV